MRDSCMHSARVEPTIANVWSLRERCPICGEFLWIRPDAQKAVFMAAILTSTLVSTSSKPPYDWYQYFLPLILIFGVAMSLGWCLVKFVPMKYISATDRAASGYRVVIAILLGVSVAIVLAWYFHKVSA